MYWQCLGTVNKEVVFKLIINICVVEGITKETRDNIVIRVHCWLIWKSYILRSHQRYNLNLPYNSYQHVGFDHKSSLKHLFSFFFLYSDEERIQFPCQRHTTRNIMLLMIGNPASYSIEDHWLIITHKTTCHYTHMTVVSKEYIVLNVLSCYYVPYNLLCIVSTA